MAKDAGLGLTRDEIEYCVLMGLTDPSYGITNADAIAMTIMFKIDKKARERK